MTTTYKTINITPNTYEQLSLYKVGKMTYDEVISNLMEEVEPEAFYQNLLVEHRRRLKKMEEEGGGISLEEAERILAEPEGVDTKR